jgi:hypothetical protein
MVPVAESDCSTPQHQPQQLHQSQRNPPKELVRAALSALVNTLGTHHRSGLVEISPLNCTSIFCVVEAVDLQNLYHVFFLNTY